MIVYTKYCLCKSKDKARLKELRQQNKVIDVRIFTRNREWHDEVIDLGYPLPFILDDGIAYDFYTGEAL